MMYFALVELLWELRLLLNKMINIIYINIAMVRITKACASCTLQAIGTHFKHTTCAMELCFRPF